MSRWVLVLALRWTAAAEDARRAQRAEVARVDAIKGALAEPCWATARNNERRLCASLDEVLETDAGGELGTVGVVIAWCADDFHWVGDVLRMVAACVEIKILRRVRVDSPRHRRDTCSMAWRCRLLTARRNMHPTHWLISTQVAANWPRGENITEWKRLVVYQKCVVHRNEAGKLVAGAGNLHSGQGRALDFAVTGPNLTLAPSDVRAACRATVGANQPVVSNAVEALDIRVVPMVEPGRAHRASTDEAGAVLHYLSESYDDLNDATFFAHGHVHGELGPFMHTLRYARLRRTVPAAFAATTRYKALRDTANAWVRDVLNVKKREADFGEKRGGAYRNGEL